MSAAQRKCEKRDVADQVDQVVDELAGRVGEMSKIRGAPPGGETAICAAYLSVRQTAALLGVSRQTVYRAVQRGELHAVKIGEAVRVPREAIEGLRSAAQPLRSVSYPAVSCRPTTGGFVHVPPP